MSSDPTARLWRVAVHMSFGAAHWADEAIAAALTLMLAGDDSPEVADVAILSPGSTSRDALDSVQALLAALHIPVLEPDATDTDRLRLLGRAFTHGGISAGEFEPYWWPALPAYQQQSKAQTEVSVAFDAWESEADIASRGPLLTELREAVVQWLADADS